MTTTTDTQEFAVLHGLRVKGLASPESVAEATGLTVEDVREQLDAAVERQLARLRNAGRVQGYMLTAAGRSRHGELRERRVADADVTALVPAYDDFLAPNREFKQVTTYAQTEAEGDVTALLSRLEPVHESVTAVLERATAVIARMATYQPRFDRAIAMIRSGDMSALAQPMTGSYHDVWMELHEDLLLTLGRERNGADE